MKKLTKQLPFVACASCLALGIAFGPKSYPVSHTENEWARQQQGLFAIQDKLRYSCVDAYTRYYTDSVTNSIISDINHQVGAAIAKDSTYKKP